MQVSQWPRLRRRRRRRRKQRHAAALAALTSHPVVDNRKQFDADVAVASARLRTATGEVAEDTRQTLLCPDDVISSGGGGGVGGSRGCDSVTAAGDCRCTRGRGDIASSPAFCDHRRRTAAASPNFNLVETGTTTSPAAAAGCDGSVHCVNHVTTHSPPSQFTAV